MKSMTDAPAAPLAHTVKGACKACGISRATFYRVVDNGELRVVKCGSKTLVLDSDLKAWLASLPAGTTMGRLGVRLGGAR